MAVIDKANAFYLRPATGSAFNESTAMAYDSTYGEQAQAASNILDFGAEHTSAAASLANYLNVVTTSEDGGSVKLQDCDTLGGVYADVPGSIVTLAAGVKAASIAMPAHRRFVKAVLTTLTSADTDVYIGARADI